VYHSGVAVERFSFRDRLRRRSGIYMHSSKLDLIASLEMHAMNGMGSSGDLRSHHAPRDGLFQGVRPIFKFK